MKKIELSWPKPKLWPNNQTHHLVLHSLRKTQKTEAFFLMRAAKAKFPPVATIVFTFCPGSNNNNKFDEDNAIAAMKAAVDGMAQASGCDDSKWTFKIKEGGRRKGVGRVVVHAEPITD